MRNEQFDLARLLLSYSVTWQEMSVVCICILSATSLMLMKTATAMQGWWVLQKKTLVLATTHTANIYYDVLLFASVICLFCSYKRELNARRKEELDNSDTNEYLAPIRALEYFQCCMFTSCVFISKNALWILLWFLWYILYIIYMYDA